MDFFSVKPNFVVKKTILQSKIKTFEFFTKLQIFPMSASNHLETNYKNRVAEPENNNRFQANFFPGHFSNKYISSAEKSQFLIRYKLGIQPTYKVLSNGDFCTYGKACPMKTRNGSFHVSYSAPQYPKKEYF